jgi:hypothetical protein
MASHFGVFQAAYGKLRRIVYLFREQGDNLIRSDLSGGSKRQTEMFSKSTRLEILWKEM